eukprot:PhF_6_TR5648/c0_g1_i2/m.8247
MKFSAIQWILVRTIITVIIIFFSCFHRLPLLSRPSTTKSLSDDSLAAEGSSSSSTAFTVIRCDNTTTMAVHIIHYLPNSHAQAALRNQHTEKVIRSLSTLPFRKIHFYLHTNNKTLSSSMFSLSGLNLTSYAKRRVVIVPYTPEVWWSMLNGNEWSALVWAARDFIARTRRFKIIMCMDNDILVTPEAILNYWCVYAPMAMDHGHHLNFILFDQTWKNKQYPSGLMTYFRYPLEKDKLLQWDNLMYSHANWSYIPDYYLPLWIIDSRRKRMFFDHSLFKNSHEMKLNHGALDGYKIRNRWLTQEEAYLSVFNTLFSSLPILGAQCTSYSNSKRRECHIHPDAFLHHLPNNYGGNEVFLKKERPLSVDEVFCLEKEGGCRSLPTSLEKFYDASH